ncbi:Aste57867_2349 [Aphanomyces stellatus]|uniref:Aste57867_2349 protein n=1 Tax=Aphanomyces stellatus TaxID=120398 RepID=A0A485K7B7_9STRA|nr:hypothetical protein As57867_002344 [Aphanomyces stellatus]VFT79550.1 Aste57867_2349 [Aphanomyces stellatus]
MCSPSTKEVFSLKVKSKSANGVSFTTEGSMTGAKSITAKVGTTFSLPQLQGFKVEKLQLTTKGRLNFKASYTAAMVDGLKLTTKLEDGSRHLKNSPAINFGAEYKHPRFTVSHEVNVIGQSVSAYCGALVGGGVSLDAYSEYNFAKRAVLDVGGGVYYDGGGDVTMDIISKKNLKAMHVKLRHKIHSDAEYTVALNHEIATAANALSLKGRYAVDKETTYRGKVSSEGKVVATVKQKITPFLTLESTANIFATNLCGNDHYMNFGVTISL